mgnify:CR=1 FL=1
MVLDNNNLITFSCFLLKMSLLQEMLKKRDDRALLKMERMPENSWYAVNLSHGVNGYRVELGVAFCGRRGGRDEWRFRWETQSAAVAVDFDMDGDELLKRALEVGKYQRILDEMFVFYNGELYREPGDDEVREALRRYCCRN